MNTDSTMHILTINAGSSSIKLALFEAQDAPKRLFEGVIENIGKATADFVVKNSGVPSDDVSKSVVAPDHITAAGILVDYLKQQIPSDTVSAIGHRIVHGGPKYYETQIIDDAMVAGLRELTHFDPEHLPVEIQLIEVFQKLFPNVKQVACFDTAFHHDLPSEARLLAIPRHYEAQGIRRYGFHGLSYAYLMREILRIEGPEAVNGRLILAHLGNGVSLTAVHHGTSIDTTMGLTPASGVPMSTRSGDIDPGLVLYLANSGNIDANQFNDMVNFQSGLLGISETTSDMKELLEHEADDTRAKEAVNLFCYQAKKSIGSLAAAMGGLDMLVFTGGMGENAPKIRARICEGLQFLGIEVEETRNLANSGAISSDRSRVVIRVIHADEASTIAGDVQQLITKG